MKKIVLFLFVAIATLSVKAQDLYMGGTVGLWRNDDVNTTSFKLAPDCLLYTSPSPRDS